MSSSVKKCLHQIGAARGRIRKILKQQQQQPRCNQTTANNRNISNEAIVVPTASSTPSSQPQKVGQENEQQRGLLRLLRENERNVLKEQKLLRKRTVSYDGAGLSFV
jgi:DNA-binding response OmpR family regulator